MLVGCTEGSVSFNQTMKLALNSNPASAIDAVQLNPKYRYLRLTYDQGAALLVLNFVDRHPNGPVEVWYGGASQVFRFQNGRLGGSTGLEPEWRSVVLPKIPPWSQIAKQTEPLRWERHRDVMPGYRFGIRDKLVVYPIAPPQRTALRDLNPASLQWFEERTDPNSNEQLPPARYAVQGEIVVYAEQCVSPQLCIKWQRWPAGS